MPDHEHFMRLAIAAAGKNPNVPFGAVLVDRRSGDVVVEGWNRRTLNPTWHGEMDAINRAAEQGFADWQTCTLYTTAEPCCMCQGAVMWAGISEVVFGSAIPTLQRMGWRQIELRANEVVRATPFGQCNVLGGVLEPECDQMFAAARSGH